MLSEWSRDELAELVERMVRREPDLIALLDSPPPGRGGSVQLGDVEAQVRQGFAVAARGGWRQSYPLARQLGDLTNVATAHIARGEVANGLTVLSAVVNGLREHYDQIHDDESEVARVVDECIAALERCIVVAKDDGVRGTAFGVLVTAYIWGESYGVAEGAPGVIDRCAGEREREAVERMLEHALSRTTREWKRRTLGTLLLDVRGDTVDDGAALELLRSTGNLEELVARLLLLHRPDEAAQVLPEARWTDIPRLCDLFREHGYPDSARRELERRLADSREQGCWLAMDWLHRLAVERGEAESQRRWAVELFWQGPSVHRWAAVRAAMREHERRGLRHRLEREGRHHVLVEILLSEGAHKAAEARNILRRADPDAATTRQLSAKIADALAPRKPKEAARLWLAEADRLAERGHPEEYEEAVELVVKGRDALLAARHPRLAIKHVEEFRSRHRRRRTLQARLDAAVAARPDEMT